MNERDFIALLRPLAAPGALNLDDDAALLSVPDGYELVISEDMMVEGVHFPEGRIGGDFSRRLLRCALSDLAAKAAKPIGYTLSVAWPRARQTDQIDSFVKELAETQGLFGCGLLGGDTTATSGPMVASVTVYGTVSTGLMIRRSGAKPGDSLWHTGRLGLAEMGLKIVTAEPIDLPDPDQRAARSAYLTPEPRFECRDLLRNFATACADISDGVVIEAGHIASASGVAIDLIGDKVAHATFGDDYELLFTSAPDNEVSLKQAAEDVGLSVTKCGTVRSGEGVTIDGKPVEARGFTHSF